MFLLLTIYCIIRVFYVLIHNLINAIKLNILKAIYVISNVDKRLKIIYIVKLNSLIGKSKTAPIFHHQIENI